MFNNIGSPPSIKLDAPYPAWSQENIHVVELAIASAWRCIVNDALLKDAYALHLLSNATEIEVSAKLIDILEGLLNSKSIKGFNGRRFCPPIRGQELENVKATELEKRPDISIRLISSIPYTQHNCLFFECKRISPTRRVSDYVDEGLMKFCDQRYAWGMPHAGMLAYVQDLDPAPQAKIELEKYWVKKPTSHTVPVCASVVDNSGSVSVTITRHKRPLPLPNGGVSGDITVRHIWLSA
ncbi:MAG: hypothetical protein V4706_08175 [Pseudomonadota bacterium]